MKSLSSKKIWLCGILHVRNIMGFWLLVLLTLYTSYTVTLRTERYTSVILLGGINPELKAELGLPMLVAWMYM